MFSLSKRKVYAALKLTRQMYTQHTHVYLLYTQSAKNPFENGKFSNICNLYFRIFSCTDFCSAVNVCALCLHDNVYHNTAI